MRRRPLLLDLFCGAGGAAVGYHRAGFDVVGVDVNSQPHYPFPLVQADALHPPFDLTRFDAIHASPPCQRFTAYRRRGNGVGDNYLDLVAATRRTLIAAGRPYVIENVPGAPLHEPVTLCGSMFGLDVRRHRLFEVGSLILQPACNHRVWTTKKYPGATNRDGRYTCEIGVWRIPLATQRAAIGIDWMTLEEISEAVPPAYTEFIGRQLIEALR